MDWLILVMLPAFCYAVLPEELENISKEMAYGIKEGVLDVADLFLSGGIK